MRNKVILSINFFICFILIIWGNCKHQIDNQKNLKQKDIENYLRTAHIAAVEIDPKGGRTEAWRISLNDGKIARKGIFKYIDRSRPAILADSYKYEIAAYELDKLLNLNIVPSVIEREIQDLKGALQLMVEDCITEYYRKLANIEPTDPKAFQSVLEDINIFENLTYNKRDANDILINKDNWKVYRVDFSQAFSPTSELLPGCKITSYSKKLYENLKKLDNSTVIEKLSPYLNDEELKALLERKNIIIDKIKQLINQENQQH